MAEYGIWFSFNNNEEGFQIPVNPPEIELGDGTKGETYDIANLGEINVIKDRKLTEYAFESFFPAQKYPFLATDRLLEPKRYVEYIEKWMGSKQPIRFIFTGASFDINTLASIEGFDWKESAGGNGDIEYKIKLKKYVPYGPKKVKVVQPQQNRPVIQKKKAPRPNNKQSPKVYTLVAGDTLWGLAKRFLGSGTRWREIAKLNGIKDSQVRRLPIGLKVKIPPK